MLSSEEVVSRTNFYTSIFGTERITQIGVYSPGFWPVANYQNMIHGLAQRGFKDPHKMITSMPAILTYSFENIDAKIQSLTERGFKDPQKLITSLPSILGYSFKNIDAKIHGLTERGFKDPHKMITSMPSILGLAFENIDAKIKGLTERGFKDPHKMIASMPSILCLAFENIDHKLKLCRRLGVDVEAFIAYSCVSVGMSAKHYVPIARRCRQLEKEPTPRNVFRVYKMKTF